MADRRWPHAAVAFATVLVLLAAAPASAQSVTVTELQALAQRAVDDPRALAQLRGIRQVDGRPVDMARALDGAEGPELAARLRTLAQPGAGPAVRPAGDVRGEATSILEGRRFQEPRVPRPLQGVLRTIGRWLSPLSNPFRSGWRWVNGSVPARIAVIGVVFAGALAVTLWLVGRRGAQAVQRARFLGVDAEGLDPDALERDATAAEQAGDLDHAVRLRFVAGVLRLDRAGVITYRSSLTTGQLKARVASPSFATLAGAFDEIAYGGRPADESDVQAAKAVWPRVLVEAGT